MLLALFRVLLNLQSNWCYPATHALEPLRMCTDITINAIWCFHKHISTNKTKYLLSSHTHSQQYTASNTQTQNKSALTVSSHLPSTRIIQRTAAPTSKTPGNPLLTNKLVSWGEKNSYKPWHVLFFYFNCVHLQKIGYLQHNNQLLLNE